ncbi:hypothetical protein EBT16_02595 [bacterium]|nr:hypothetical protein [bacterium]
MKPTFIRFSNTHGFTLWGTLAILLVLGIAGTYLGKVLYFSIKARNRVEAKTSVIDNESTLAELIATKMKEMQENFVPLVPGSTFCSLNAGDFKTSFNTNSPVFPAPSVALKIETDRAAEPTLKQFDAWLAAPLPGVQQDTKNALNTCSNLTTPSVNTTADLGVYMFCVALDNTNVEPQKSKSFLYSEGAFVQVRAELTHQSLSQDEKVLKQAPLCADWLGRPTNQKQLKITYRIFWKERGNSQGFYSYLGSKLLNLPELRNF